jgi:hypothetical protein
VIAAHFFKILMCTALMSSTKGLAASNVFLKKDLNADGKEDLVLNVLEHDPECEKDLSEPDKVRHSFEIQIAGQKTNLVIQGPCETASEAVAEKAEDKSNWRNSFEVSFSSKAFSLLHFRSSNIDSANEELILVTDKNLRRLLSYSKGSIDGQSRLKVDRKTTEISFSAVEGLSLNIQDKPVIFQKLLKKFKCKDSEGDPGLQSLFDKNKLEFADPKPICYKD